VAGDEVFATEVPLLERDDRDYAARDAPASARTCGRARQVRDHVGDFRFVEDGEGFDGNAVDVLFDGDLEALLEQAEASVGFSV
jgi:hypothetical protein